MDHTGLKRDVVRTNLFWLSGGKVFVDMPSESLAHALVAGALGAPMFPSQCHRRRLTVPRTASVPCLCAPDSFDNLGRLRKASAAAAATEYVFPVFETTQGVLAFSRFPCEMI